MITNLSGEILIGKDLSIVGPGAASLAVSGNGASRVFNIAGGATVNLSGLTLRNGHAGDGAAGTSNATPGSPGADGGGAGGGAYSLGGSSLQNVLAAQDSAGAGGLAGAGGAGGAGHPSGSGGSPGSSGSGGSGPDLLGAFTSNGYNLVGLGEGCSGFTDGVLGDIVGSGTPLNPVLGSLSNNGGPTFTCAVLCGSPALDTGDDTLLGAAWNLATDQRSLPRQSGSHVDIGAYEVQRAASPIGVAVCTTTTNGAVQMTATNVPGASLTVLAATNPASSSASWTALGLMPEIATGQFQFVDPTPTNVAQRFYRLRCP
jgi:hypothetical protein